MEVPYTPASVSATVLLLYSFPYKALFIIFMLQLVAISIGVLEFKSSSAAANMILNRTVIKIIQDQVPYVFRERE